MYGSPRGQALASRCLKVKFYSLGLWTYGLGFGLESPDLDPGLEVSKVSK